MHCPPRSCPHQLGPDCAPVLKFCYVVVCVKRVTVRRVSTATVPFLYMLLTRQIDVAIPLAYARFHKVPMQLNLSKYYVLIPLASY